MSIFLKIKNGSLIANIETPKNAMFETNSVLKGLKPLFFHQGNGVLENAGFVPVYTNWEKIMPTIQS